MLRNAVRHGAATLGTLAEQAIRRYLDKPGARRLFSDQERAELGRALAATNATAELLGRSRIRKRLEQAEKHAESFAEATDFSCFDESPIHPLSPLRALAWFKKLIPGLRPDPEKFAAAHERQGFNLAVTTEKTLLQKIKDLISRALETGQNIRQTPKAIEQLLDDAGVSPRSPQYAEMAFRTNMMSAYNRGSHEEMQDPDVAPHFPVWRYVGIRDGRQGKDHEPHFDKYYPNSASFEEVRGPRAYNCRCTSIPIYKKEWAHLQSEGAQASKFAERAEPRLLAVPDIRQPDSFSCGAASAMAVGRYFSVGPEDLEDWKRLLGTDPDNGTPPQAIVRVLRGLGLRVEARQDMTIDDLRDCWQQDSPVICPIQDYGAEQDRRADEAGHYVTVVGVALGFVFVQDSMQDVELEGSNSDAEPGRVMIDEQRFLRVWHDRGADGTIYRRFGIIVSR